MRLDTKHAMLGSQLPSNVLWCVVNASLLRLCYRHRSRDVTSAYYRHNRVVELKPLTAWYLHVLKEVLSHYTSVSTNFDGFSCNLKQQNFTKFARRGLFVDLTLRMRGC